MKLLPLALLALSYTAAAQTIPGAGSQLRQIPTPAPVLGKDSDIRIQVAPANAPTSTNTTRVLVKALRVTGAKAYSTEELVRVAGFSPGAQLTLGDLQTMAGRITTHYRQHGYFVARAYLPEQNAVNNTITIAVSEGQYGQVVLHNTSGLHDSVAQRPLAGIKPGEPITLEPLEHRLLLLSDIPGVQVSSNLAPGASPGSSDLIVEIVDGRRVTGSVDVDNAGNYYTGENRVGATVNFNNPTGHGDLASARVLTSGQGLQYGRVSYQAPIGPVTAGAAYSYLNYHLGKEFEVLDGHGTARVASVFVAAPLIRSRTTNLGTSLSYDDKRFDDRLDAVGVDTRKDAHVVTGSIYGNRQDQVWGGGTNSFVASLSAGTLDIQTPGARLADDLSARSNGSYQKLLVSGSRVQRVSNTVSVKATLTGQLASKNLDASEKLVGGGLDGVRAYPQGEAFGDQGVMLNLEARKRLDGLATHLPGTVSLIGFVDTAHVTVDKNPWHAGDNHRNLSGAGVGLAWEKPSDFAVRMYYAHTLGSEPALAAPDHSGHFWIQAVKYF